MTRVRTVVALTGNETRMGRIYGLSGNGLPGCLVLTILTFTYSDGNETIVIAVQENRFISVD